MAHTAVGVGNFVDLIGVKPDLVLTAVKNGGGKSLLKTKTDHFILYY